MKKILLIALLFLVGRESAWAGPCEASLGIAFTPAQQISLCKAFGSAIATSLIPATNNAIDLGKADKAFRTAYFGTSIISTATNGVLGTDTADAADSKSVALASGGVTASATRGGYIQLNGNERGGNPGKVFIGAGDAALGSIELTTAGLTRFSITSTGALTQDATNGGNIVLNKAASEITLSGAGSTIAFQEATAGSACSGTLTLNGATPVVTATTCAVTGARIFLTRSSAETTALNPFVSAISTGVSFSVTSEAGDTGTMNWVIFKEAA